MSLFFFFSVHFFACFLFFFPGIRKHLVQPIAQGKVVFLSQVREGKGKPTARTMLTIVLIIIPNNNRIRGSLHCQR